MITLHSYEISADIKNRYASCSYLFGFENTNTSGSNELKFEITIDPNAFISKFTADIDGELFIGDTKEKQTASNEYRAAKQKDENAILISQPHPNIPNVFEVKTNVDAKSKVTLTIQIEQYLHKTFDFNALDIQILRNFTKYNIKQEFDRIPFTLHIQDDSGIYDVQIPMTKHNTVKAEQNMGKSNHTCEISGVILNKPTLKHSSPSTVELRNMLKINNTIDVLDTSCGKWFKSVIKKVDKEAQKVTIHYCGYDSKYDESIAIHDDRLAPENTHTAGAKLNELTLKYKIKGEQNDSHILFDHKTHTFCHIISDIITDSTVIDEANDDTNEGGDDCDLKHAMLIARRVVFVIDRSGSMGGVKWLNTISAMTKAIKQLRTGYDRFNVLLFNNDIEIHDRTGCVLAEDNAVSGVIHSLQNTNVGGGTNINDALLKAIELIKMDIISLNANDECEYNFFMNQIIFMTDGRAQSGETDTNKIITNIQKANDLSGIDAYNKKISIFSFGVGNDGNDSAWIKDLNHSFLKLLSVHNHGFYQRIKESSADTKLAECFSILSKPMLSNIKVQYENANVTHSTQTTFNTLFCGNDLIICGKIDARHTMDYLTLNATITATTGKTMKRNKQTMTKPIQILKKMKLNIDSAMDNHNNSNTERIWAYLKLQQYATEKLMHHKDMIEEDDDEKKEQQALPLSLALQFKFVTPWSSMIVVKQKDIGNIKEQSHSVSNAGIPRMEERVREYGMSELNFASQNDIDIASTAQSFDAFPISVRSSASACRMYNTLQTAEKQCMQRQQYLSASLCGLTPQQHTHYSRGAKRKRRNKGKKHNKKRLRNKKRISRSSDALNPMEEKKFNPHNVSKHYANKLHEVISTWYPQQAGKLTGMFLQNHDEEKVIKYLGRQDRLRKKIDAFASLLAHAPTPHGAQSVDALQLRLKQEINDLESHPIPNCSVETVDHMKLWKVTMMGSNPKLYDGDMYCLEIKIPSQFPMKPPQVTFITKMRHPNVGVNGSVDLDMLREDHWSADCTIKGVLLAIIKLLSKTNEEAEEQKVSWDERKVSQWVNARGEEYGQYVEGFIDHGINGRSLCQCGEDEAALSKVFGKVVSNSFHREKLVSDWIWDHVFK
eukprot:695742_1